MSRPARHLAWLLTPAACYTLGMLIARSPVPDWLDRWDQRRRAAR